MSHPCLHARPCPTSHCPLLNPLSLPRMEWSLLVSNMGNSGALHTCYIAPGRGRVKSCLHSPGVQEGWCPFLQHVSFVYVPGQFSQLFLPRHIALGFIWLISDQVLSSWWWAKWLCWNLHSRAKAMDGLNPLPRIDWVEGRYSPSFMYCLSTWIAMFKVNSHAPPPPFPHLNVCGELTYPVQWESCETKYHHWYSLGLLAFLLFGVAGLMRRVPELCYFIVEETHLKVADESPHWKGNSEVKRPSRGHSSIRSFLSNDCIAY